MNGFFSMSGPWLEPVKNLKAMLIRNILLFAFPNNYHDDLLILSRYIHSLVDEFLEKLSGNSFSTIAHFVLAFPFSIIMPI